MDDNGSSSNGKDTTLGKLLPKVISEKRRRRKQKKIQEAEAAGVSSLNGFNGFQGLNGSNGSPGGSRNGSSSLLESDSTGFDSPASSRLALNDDDRSFGSFESGPDPQTRTGSRSNASSLRTKSRSPSRPTVSPHPSLIGYLTTSSPVVQATHINPHTQPARSARSTPSSPSTRPSKGNTAAALQEAFQTPNDRAITTPDILRSLRPSSSSSRESSKRPTSLVTPLTSAINKDENPPAIINTPPTPTDLISESSSSDKKPTRKASSTNTSVDGTISLKSWTGHRRISSASAALGPSKLSNVLSSPLTPTNEDAPLTSNNSAGNNNTGTGFFSSMFSAAQNAATNFSSNIQNTGLSLGVNKGRTTPLKQEASKEIAELEAKPESPPDTKMDSKMSTLQTIGSGDLSMSALGLDEPVPSVISPSSAKFTDAGDMRARSDSAPADGHSHNEYMAEEASSRPRSLNEAANGEVSPLPSEFGDKVAQKSESMRSTSRTHRKRASSATTSGTGVTIAAPSPLNNPAANFSTQKLTGFAIASKKRNRDFHNIFKSVPDDDYLIEDYSCALQREILAHGRLYVSEGHLCFSSNILGWQTTLVVSFDEITSVEKRSTALVFKNGLTISTLHSKHVFASFTSRDATYDLIINIWKLGHPTVTSTLNGIRLEGTGGDKTIKPDSEQAVVEVDNQTLSESEEESGDEEEFYDEEEGDDTLDSNVTEPNGGDAETEKLPTRKASGMTTMSGVGANQGKEGAQPSAADDFPGPTTHGPTECADAATHYDRVVGDEIIPAPLGKVYNLLFGQASGVWMTKFLSDVVKGTEVQFEDRKGLSLDNKTRSYSYIKPLNAPIGPKQTKCMTTETLDSLDFEKAASMTVTTQTPDVPSGNVFMVKTRYCLSWADNNSTRLHVNCTVEWTGKSWLKAPIEKGANDGQLQYCKDISAALKAAVSTATRSGPGANGVSKGKRKGKKGKANQAPEFGVREVPKDLVRHDWGPLEIVRPVVEPMADILKPLITSNMMYGLLVGLLVSMWFGFGFPVGKHTAQYGHGPVISRPERLAAYEEMWLREESGLWEWFEERVGLERLSSHIVDSPDRAASRRSAAEKVFQKRMDTRELQEALRVTEEKLKILQEAMRTVA